MKYGWDVNPLDGLHTDSFGGSRNPRIWGGSRGRMPPGDGLAFEPLRAEKTQQSGLFRLVSVAGEWVTGAQIWWGFDRAICKAGRDDGVVWLREIGK